MYCTYDHNTTVSVLSNIDIYRKHLSMDETIIETIKVIKSTLRTEPEDISTSGRDGGAKDCQVLSTVWKIFQNTGSSINVIAIALKIL